MEILITRELTGSYTIWANTKISDVVLIHDTWCLVIEHRGEVVNSIFALFSKAMDTFDIVILPMSSEEFSRFTGDVEILCGSYKKCKAALGLCLEEITKG